MELLYSIAMIIRKRYTSLSIKVVAPIVTLPLTKVDMGLTEISSP